MSTSESDSIDVSDAPGVNRRATYVFLLAALFALVGLADAIYLTVEHLAGRSVRCTITSGCNEVLNSAYSTIAGVPLAPLGAVAYFLAFSLATLAAFGNQLARVALVYLMGLMLAFSIWLFIVQAFVLHAFCQFCLLSGAVTLLISVLVALEHLYRQRPQS